MEQYYSYLELGVLIVLGAGLFFGLIRAVRGPRIADRIVGGNLAGTMTIMIIAILADFLKQDWLLDVCLIYCMMSFLAVVVLSKIYISVDREKKEGERGKEE
ncbi:MAG: sodium:proton antiporter [Oscillospiraceae bacterium]|nr:sodium:proton antiporter [Oscillospiraceae bacterium]